MPNAIIPKRVCAEADSDFVLFLIGMRINKPWKVWSWAPVARRMPLMLAELAARPELGLLHARSHLGFPNLLVIQYWRSFDHLEAYARAGDHLHLPAWSAFNRAVGSNGDVGIWHETYSISQGRYETIYNNMPPFGLGAWAPLVDAAGARQEARRRITRAA